MTTESVASCCSPLCSTEAADERIQRDIANAVTYFAEHPEEIDGRLAALEEEWHMDRVLQANAGIVILTGIVFGIFSRKYRLLALMASVFLISRAFGHWCPAETIWRRLGVRTQREVLLEGCALKALRGDFQDVPGAEDPRERARRALKAVGLDEA
jgi:hypothetical protein